MCERRSLIFRPRLIAESPALSRNAQNEPPLSGYKIVSESFFDQRRSAGKRRPTGLEVAASDEPFVFASQTYEGSLIVLGCKLALAVPTVQQAWASSGVRAGDRIVAVNGTAGPAEKLLSLLRRDNKKRRLTLVRPQTEESVGWGIRSGREGSSSFE